MILQWILWILALVTIIAAARQYDLASEAHKDAEKVIQTGAQLIAELRSAVQDHEVEKRRLIDTQEYYARMYDSVVEKMEAMQDGNDVGR